VGEEKPSTKILSEAGEVLPGSRASAAQRTVSAEFLKSLKAPVLVAIAYYLGAQAAFAVGTLSDRIFAPFWPPNAVLFCTLILVPKRRWWLYIAAAFPAHVLAELSVGMPADQQLVAFVTNCMVATLSAWGVQRFLKEPPWFGTLRNASIYILITAGISPAISAFGGAFVQLLGDGRIDNYWAYWGYWYISNALGSVTLGPVFLTWFDKRSWAERLNANRMFEAGILGLGLGVVVAFVFHSGRGTVESGFLPALLYSPLPFILWAAIRFGQRGASGAVLVVTIVSIWQNLHESAVFVGDSPEKNVLALQFFLMGLAIPVFFLGAVIDELGRTGLAMRELAGSLLRVQDEERRRIARELHDSTGQNLTAASLLVSRLEATAPPPSATVVAELGEILRQSMVEIRTVSYLLHPPLLDGIGLDMALRTFLQGFSKRTGIDVELDLPEETGRMPSAVELVLFRVIQEALTNVWRHSGSKTARIQLVEQDKPEGRLVNLSIEDFGTGIPHNIRASTLSRARAQHNVSTGLGLVGMRERLHQIGGSLEIDSSGGGTVIRAIVTLPEFQ
jgi:integral membrane sensor domain MASE1/anti-sigma regulatory factor (Ser/Thr protein kinase)